jgi:sec-independent protein translocase protein TatB
LLVLGPERLPGAARTAGLWVGRLKRSFNAIKQEVEREIGADEIRRQLRNEEILSLEREMRNAIKPPEPLQSQASPETVEAALQAEPKPGPADQPPADTAAPESTPPRHP